MAVDVTVSRDIAAPPEQVWDLIADLPRMGEWSPENEGGEWLGGATGPTPGAKFKGANRNGEKRWKTVATILDVQPGRRLAFKVTAMGLPISEWTYELEPTESGCRVTESWTDRRPGFFKPIAAKATGVTDREEFTRGSITQTLDALAAAAAGV